MFLSGKAGRDVLKGGAGDDTLYGFGGDDSLSGGGGHDVLAGNEGNDTLSGGTGDDYLLGGLGNDVIDGGAGVDWAAYEDATAAVKVDLNLTVAQATGGAGSDKLTGIENLYGSAFNDTLIGNAGVNYLSGGAGNDRLEGGAGDDHLEGGRGDDELIGGDGFDVVTYSEATQGIWMTLGSGAGSSEGDGRDFLYSIEAVIGTRFDDSLNGGIDDNYIEGGDGNDRINGGWGGNDVLDGGAGDDVVWINYGRTNTVIRGGDGDDTLVFDWEAGFGIKIDLNNNDAQEVLPGRILTINSIENIQGTPGDDTFVSSPGKNLFHGYGGTDLFIFKPGDAPLDQNRADMIFDFKGGEDKISLGVVGNYRELVTSTYAEAYSQAKSLISSGTSDIVFVDTDYWGYIFADGMNNNQLTTVVVLPFSTIDSISASDFV